jgi:hypothetical protein
LKNSLESLLSSENIPLDNIKSAKIRINFNLEETKLSSNVPGLELPKYYCEAEIIDINGKVYKKEVIEWWKY